MPAGANDTWSPVQQVEMKQTDKRALIVVAHGSRREASNEEIRDLARRLAGATDSFGRVSAAFLELADPSIPEGIEQSIRDGADEVVVFPYFLSAGRHVVVDIPAEVARVKERYPDARIQVADYLGALDAIPDLILRHLPSD